MTTTDFRSGGVFALSTSERVAYGAGSLATATYAVVPGLVLLYYLTNVLGVEAAAAGFVVFLPKLLDVVYNPIVGRLSDSTVSRLGPRRPWMIAGMITFPLGFGSIFFSPFTGVAAAWWVAIALALTGLGFSAFVVPFGVLPAELGASTEERMSMTAWRMAFLGVAILGAAAVASLITAVDGGGREGYRVMAVVMGCVVFLGTCAALYSARRPARTTVSAAPKGAGSLREALAAARRNRPFCVLFGVFMLIEVIISVALASLPYMAEQILGSAEAVAPLFVCVLGPMLLTMPVWSRSARRYGEKRCLQVALAIFGVGTFTVTALPWVADPSKFSIAWAAFLMAGIGFAGAQLLPTTMLADTLADDAGESGQRRAGVLVGLWSAGETTAAAAGAGAYGFVLAASGFLSATSDEVVIQPRSAQLGIVLGFSVISSVCILAALALMTRYTPHGDRTDGSTRRRPAKQPGD
ncbi:MFS transporter [Mycobacterium deserti]|uniref:MFS transporter n=1 Tax=Mycobacterium deserti TaxID=2978347 RepID=A0ABT2MDM5_9MYCO|nr:MFS transporter [Mycobacterium deserti]MCT7660351.1 MFS transporter [Mycobacterium deserti]